MFKKISAIVTAFVLVFLIVAAFQPTDYRVERSLVINADASTIFPQVNDLRAWEKWSPWVKMDPDAKSSYEGPRAGKGAIMRWEGNMAVGAGSMTITSSRPHKAITLDLNFLKPMKGEAVSEFTFVPEKNGTKVTWSMAGKNGFAGKIMGLLMDCDKMIGDQYEKGLANLKGVAEYQETLKNDPNAMGL